jgi:hypothetical protein
VHPTSFLADPAPPISPELLPIALGTAVVGVVLLVFFLLRGYRK